MKKLIQIKVQMKVKDLFFKTDRHVTDWMARYGIELLRLSLGLIFLWFGVLKYFPNLSPAQQLASQTLIKLTPTALPPQVSVFILATWECLIGLGLITRRAMRLTLLLLFIQMLGTLTPLLLFPGQLFLHIPYAPTLEGQYIIKNLVLISAGLVLGATVRGGAVIADPKFLPPRLPS